MSEKYSIGELIEKGNFSIIHKFIDKKNSDTFAGKIISLQNAKNHLYITEENIIKSMNHPNIIKFKESFSDEKNHYILTYYYPNGNLYNLFLIRKKLTELEIKYYIIQLVSALIYLKKNNVIHRDIKPHHLLISDDLRLKLCGFHGSFALKSKENKINGCFGTPNYIAPEIIKQEYYSFEIDVWSLGATIFFLFTGFAPFQSKDKNETFEKIKSGKFSFPNDCEISDTAKDLIQKMLTLDPSKRITIEEVYSHDFFKFGIPESLPLSTLKEPPSKEFIEKYSKVKYIRENKEEEDKKEILDLRNRLKQTNNLLANEKKITQQLSERVKNLEKELKIEKNKNFELTEKNKELENLRNNNSNKDNKDNIMKLMDKLLLKEEEIQEMKSRYPFEISKGEKLMSVIFMSSNQEIHYSIICKDSDKFTSVENSLYDEFPRFRETENFFLSNGNKINKYKTLKENNLKNGSIIILNQLNDDEE